MIWLEQSCMDVTVEWDRVVSGLVKADDGIEFVAGVDAYTGIKNDYPVFESIDKCDVEADVVIDFSNASAAARTVRLLRGETDPGGTLFYRFI